MGEEFEPEAEAAAEAELTGRGTTADGMIEAVVGANGRLDLLRLDPELRKVGPYGPVVDSETMANEIRRAVNAALDDLEQKVQAQAGDAASSLANDLDAMAQDFERSLGQLATDIAKAERKLQ